VGAAVKRAIAVLAVLLGLLWAQPASAAFARLSSGACSSSNATCDISLTGTPDIIVVGGTCAFCNTSTGVPTDSQGNTYLLADANTVNGDWGLYYVQSPSISGTLTVHWGGISIFGGAAVAIAFTGSTTTPLDQHNHFQSAAATTTTVQPGSITPTVTGTLIVTVVSSTPDDTTQSINSSMTVDSAIGHGGGGPASIAMAWVEYASTSAINPTWTIASANFPEAQIANFKPGGGASPTSHPCGPLKLLGVGCEAQW
jgi:hypothetical protein